MQEGPIAVSCKHSPHDFPSLYWGDHKLHSYYLLLQIVKNLSTSLILTFSAPDVHFILKNNISNWRTKSYFVILLPILYSAVHDFSANETQTQILTSQQ